MPENEISVSAALPTGTIRHRAKFRTLFAVLVILLLVSMVGAVSIGQISIPFAQTFKILVYQLTGADLGHIADLAKGMEGNIIWEIRLPRVFMALLVGAGLAMCGTVMQATVQNPLADPYLMGISSGAVLGATFAILFGLGKAGWIGEMGVAFWAFAGALGAAAIVLVLASIGGKTSSVKLVLAGLVINALCGALSNFIISIANNVEGIRTLTFWTMGSLASAKWDKLPLVAAAVVLAAIFMLMQSRILNTMLMGDEAAVTLGIDLTSYRRTYLVLTSIVTGVIVAACGTIGFVGLIVPHIVRSLFGSDHKRLLPLTIVAGSILLVWTDLGARIVLENTELPVGVLTAFIGAPMFMYILIRRNYGFGGN